VTPRPRTAARFGCTSESPDSRTASGYVYFLQPKFNEEGPVKVGYSADPIRRLREHNNRLRDEPLALVGVFPANREQERELHRRWRRHRVLGEWFRPAPEIRAAIDLSAALHFEDARAEARDDG
jgi:hypothetical protein